MRFRNEDGAGIPDRQRRPAASREARCACPLLRRRHSDSHIGDRTCEFGDAHVECVHPKIKKSTRDQELSAEELGIKLDPIGVRGGWANWPMNFDPCWIELCKGYKKVDSK